ncbi:aldose 1-epimerase family protein [Bifidobacterium sp. CP2]|uniref:aldose 1-epimerase family protein n=1 Tax=Bifidobacterium sp. CP2 TaxID=2809025 RepID=UPI001BDCE66C|nr:aldose 1-epimerase family protein [Bifidobacterium sp. CP2]MBT1181120.1 aldose 1-epimerase family protein [Bifidobacterium sp. CP2]
MVLKPRTGNQYSIRKGDWSAVVTELGASLRELRWQGEDIIVPFDPNKVIPCCNGWVLAPYPNRVTDGQYTFDGESYQMPIDEFDRSASLHGYAYRYMWKLEDLGESHVTLSWRSPDLAGYPFDITITATYALEEDGLHETFTVHNNDEVRAPWAFGIHPWLSNGKTSHGPAITPDNERCRLTLPCATHVTVDEHLLPTGEEPVAGIYDLRDDPTLEGRGFDDAWTDIVDRDADGGTSAVFTRPDGIKVTLTGDGTINSWQVCTGNEIGEKVRQPGVAVEPMTAYADAFRSGKDLVVLEPGDDYTTRVTFRAERV